MAYSYEAVVSTAGLEMFREAFSSYMARLDFAHMSVGGWLGESSDHQFRRDDRILSLSTSRVGQSHVRIVVHSDTVEVEPLVLDVLTEGVADFLEPFCDTLTERNAEQILAVLVKNLRDAFDLVVAAEK